MGRNSKLRKLRWMSYEAALLTVRQEAPHVKSRREYYKWHRSVRPVGLPRFPHRVYLKEWKGWPAFLGTDNVFAANKTREYRPYWEAVRFVQTLGLKTSVEYLDAYEAGKIPADIPKSPNQWYQEWTGWPSFLGRWIENKVEAAKADTAVMGLCHPSGMPVGYVKVVIAEHGVASFRKKCDDSGMMPYRVYKWDKTKTEAVKAILAQNGSPHDDGLWLVRNVHNVTFELDNMFDWVKFQ